MFDPFEMKATTVPSRFYIAVLDAIERGHKHADGVTVIDGAVRDYRYVVIFEAINNSHILFVGESWLVDGNRKIALTVGEVDSIYNTLKSQADNDSPRDLSVFEQLFTEINDQQVGVVGKEQEEAVAELESIAESKKSIQDRLPDSHDDVKNLPYYNKSLENKQFRAAQEQLKKAEKEKEKNKLDPTPIADSTPAAKEPPAQTFPTEKVNPSSIKLPSEKHPHDGVGTAVSHTHIAILSGLVILGLALLYFRRNQSRR
jgi:hypothetical protein